MLYIVCLCGSKKIRTCTPLRRSYGLSHTLTYDSSSGADLLQSCVRLCLAPTDKAHACCFALQNDQPMSEDVHRIAPRKDQLALFNRIAALPPVPDVGRISTTELANMLRSAIMESAVKLHSLELGLLSHGQFHERMEKLHQRWGVPCAVLCCAVVLCWWAKHVLSCLCWHACAGRWAGRQKVHACTSSAGLQHHQGRLGPRLAT